MSDPICEICNTNPRTGWLMCEPCSRSYDRTAHRDGSVGEAMLWAANRARRFEKAKGRREHARRLGAA